MTLQLGNEKHAVRCCDDTGNECVTPRPCQLAATYSEAEIICSTQGLRLCGSSENLNYKCCLTGCNIDSKTMWIADDLTGIHMML